VVTEFDLTGKLTAPVVKAQPDMSIDATQYEETIVWKTEHGP
jgi:hypothetical protein